MRFDHWLCGLSLNASLSQTLSNELKVLQGDDCRKILSVSANNDRPMRRGDLAQHRGVPFGGRWFIDTGKFTR